MGVAVITAVRLPTAGVLLPCLPGKTEILFKLRAPSVPQGHRCYHSSLAPCQRPECHTACQVKKRFSSKYKLEGFYEGAAVIMARLPPGSVQNATLLAR
jgi:hypothetical protein